MNDASDLDSNPSSPHEALGLAKRHQDAGNPHAAERVIRWALDFNPDYSGLLTRMSDIAMRHDQSDAAVTWPPPSKAPPPKPPVAGTAQQQPKPPAPPTPPRKRYERPPEIIGLDTEALVAERGLQGRAARFYPQSHQLFVNLTYASIEAMAGHLTAEFAHAGSPETVREKALAIARRMTTLRIARALVFSLTKKSEGWTVQQVQSAQSPESLSLIADDWVPFREPARLALEAAIGSGQPIAQAA